MSDSFNIKGKLSCPVHRRYESGGSSHVTTVGHYEAPASIRVQCKGEKSRCSVSYDDCVSIWEGEAPAKPTRRSVKDLLLPEGVSRGRDNSGSWNTTATWRGAKQRWYGSREASEEFSIQVWDDDKASGRSPEVFFGARAARRPYPRADLSLEVDSGHIEVSPSELRKVADVFRSAIARGGVTRYSGTEREELDRGPPIRVGGEVVDWREGASLSGARGTSAVAVIVAAAGAFLLFFAVL